MMAEPGPAALRGEKRRINFSFEREEAQEAFCAAMSATMAMPPILFWKNAIDKHNFFYRLLQCHES